MSRGPFATHGSCGSAGADTESGRKRGPGSPGARASFRRNTSLAPQHERSYAGRGLRTPTQSQMAAADIESIPMFAQLSSDERARVARVARAVQLDVGHVVVNEGEFAFDFYAIKRGTAEVQQGGERIRALGAGDVFGEIGVVPNHARRWKRRRTATVIVTAPTEAIVIDGSDFRRLTQDIPTLQDAIRATAAGRSRAEPS